MSFKTQFFQAAPEVAPERVETPAGPVLVYPLTVGEKDRLDRANARAKGRRFRARLVIATARDADGRSLFADEDLEQLDALPASYLEPLVEAAVRVNSMSDDVREADEKN
jgi:hypothetical protein